MSETVVSPSATDTKPCKVCGEAIKKAARVCIHCNNYQDWRADINISSTVLSLLVALLSVLTVTVPVVKDVFTPKNSNLTYSFQGATKLVATEFVTNTGTRPGIMRYPISLLLKFPNANQATVPLSLTQNRPSSAAASSPSTTSRGFPSAAAIVKAGKSELLNLYLDYDQGVPSGQPTQPGYINRDELHPRHRTNRFCQYRFDRTNRGAMRPIN
jgi:predicted nucleic acid-binding Zn ribbon protein